MISLWRDSQSYIYNSLKQLSNQEEVLGNEYSFFYSFYENDSIDDTSEILRQWLEDRSGMLLTEIRNDPKWESVPSISRTQAMALYRNFCLDSIRDKNYDYVFIVDSDIYYDKYHFKSMIEMINNNKLYGMLTSNTQQNVSDQFDKNYSTSYYDSWALKDIQGNQALSFAFNPFVMNRDRWNWDKLLPISVSSAFGGISLVRGSLLQDNQLFWNGDLGCEHWYFCKKIREMNYLIVVHPLLCAEVKHHRSINVDLFQLIFDKLRLIKYNMKTNNFHDKSKKIIITTAIFIFHRLFILKKFLLKIIIFILKKI